jgi:hypothetical protein
MTAINQVSQFIASIGNNTIVAGLGN